MRYLSPSTVFRIMVVVFFYIFVLNLNNTKIYFVFEFRQWFHKNGLPLEIEKCVVFDNCDKKIVYNTYCVLILTIS